MNDSQVVGLDLSLTATGIAMPDGTEVIRTRATGPERLRIIREVIMDGVGGRTRLVVIEGYSYASRNGGERLGELGGVIRLALWEKGVAYVEVAPAALKKFATGVGNANKNAVLVAGVRAGFTGNDDNACDAWWLREMGLYAYGLASAATATKARGEAIAKVDWPADLAVAS